MTDYELGHFALRGAPRGLRDVWTRLSFFALDERAAMEARLTAIAYGPKPPEAAIFRHFLPSFASALERLSSASDLLPGDRRRAAILAQRVRTIFRPRSGTSDELAANMSPQDLTDDFSEGLPDSTGGRLGGLGESDAHRALKNFVANDPTRIGLEEPSASSIEHQYRSPDRADVVFTCPNELVVAVEIEIEGAAETLIGAWQAVKYRALSCLEHGRVLDDKRCRAILIAYSIPHSTRQFCDMYGIGWMEFSKKTVAEWWEDNRPPLEM